MHHNISRPSMRLVPLAALLLALTQPLSITVSLADNKSSPPKPAKVQPQETQNFERFRHARDSWDVLNDPAVKTRIGKLMGSHATDFWDCAQLGEEPKLAGDYMLVVASVRGLYPFMQAMVCLNLATGQCYACYLSDDKVHVYGANSTKEMPGILRNYISKLSSKATLFEKSDGLPEKQVVKPPPKKNLNLTTVTGTYKRNAGSRFIEGSLEVLALPGNKVAFELEAANGGNSGEAEGIVPIANGRAVYKDNGGQLNFHFQGKSVVVTGNDEPFCGMGVTLLGTFVKTDDKPPKDLKDAK